MNDLLSKKHDYSEIHALLIKNVLPYMDYPSPIFTRWTWSPLSMKPTLPCMVTRVFRGQQATRKVRLMYLEVKMQQKRYEWGT